MFELLQNYINSTELKTTEPTKGCGEMIGIPPALTRSLLLHLSEPIWRESGLIG